MKRSLFFIPVIAICALPGNAQDSRFSNSNQNLIHLNPSFAGSNGGLRHQTSYRDQWLNISGSYSYLNSSTDFMIRPLKGAAAIEVFSSSSGDVFSSQGAAITYARHLKLCEGRLTVMPSIRVMYTSRKANFSNLTFGQINTQWGFHMPMSARKDVISFSTGFAAMWGDRLTGGAYFFHVNQPDEGLLGVSPLRMRTVVHAGYTFYKGDKHQAQLLGIVGGQGSYRYTQIALNALLFRHVICGAGYHSNDAVFVNAGFHHRDFNVVLAYDVVVSRLAGNTGGTLELGASFSLFRPNKEVVVPFERM